MKSAVRISDSSVQITRYFDAPRHIVFGFWSSAEKYQLWSRCKGATRCEVVMDFRVGASFTHKMEIAMCGETCEFSVTGIYEEIVEGERIVYRANLGPATTRTVIEFHDEGKGTKVVLTTEGLPDESFGKNVAQGTTESFDELDSVLAGACSTI